MIELSASSAGAAAVAAGLEAAGAAGAAVCAINGAARVADASAVAPKRRTIFIRNPPPSKTYRERGPKVWRGSSQRPAGAAARLPPESTALLQKCNAHCDKLSDICHRNTIQCRWLTCAFGWTSPWPAGKAFQCAPPETATAAPAAQSTPAPTPAPIPAPIPAQVRDPVRDPTRPLAPAPARRVRIRRVPTRHVWIWRVPTRHVPIWRVPTRHVRIWRVPTRRGLRAVGHRKAIASSISMIARRQASAARARHEVRAPTVTSARHAPREMTARHAVHAPMVIRVNRAVRAPMVMRARRAPAHAPAVPASPGRQTPPRRVSNARRRPNALPKSRRSASPRRSPAPVSPRAAISSG